MSLYEGILIGGIQGITEWLPISSEGLITSIASLGFEHTFKQAVSLSIWLHLGTACAATISFRRHLLKLLQGLIKDRQNSKELGTLIMAVLISGLIGFPLLLLIREVQLTEGAGDVTMVLIGFFMVISGFVQRYRGNSMVNITGRDLSVIDATVLGIAQGLAVMPGLSRSGLTVSVLLLRGLEQQKAIIVSYIISIPVALGAAVYIGITDGLFLSAINLLAGFVAFVSGLLTIRIVLSFARRVNISKLLIGIGVMMIFASIPFLGVRLYLT